MSGGRALDPLLAGLVDYAGLFPPAALAMPDAVASYARHLAGPDRRLLGRFVLPAARLGELAVAVDGLSPAQAPPRGAPWHLSALAGVEDAPRLAEFNAREAGRLVVDAVEAKAESVEAIEAIGRALGARYTTFVELPVRDDPTALLMALGAWRLRAKIRTGGVTADAFPDPGAVLRFLAGCARLGVPFKATAGLHHPLRGEYPLTYAADAPSGTMHGFLNIFLAAALLRAGARETDVAPLLEERDAGAFEVDDAAIRWRGRALTRGQLEDARAALAGSFGSCSFDEPVRDLTSLRLL